MEINLVRATRLEELVDIYKIEHIANPNSSINLERKDKIARETVAAFHFLSGLGKPNSPLTLEEFEIAQKEIKIRTEQDLKFKERESSWNLFRLKERSKEIKELRFTLENLYGSWLKYRRYNYIIICIGEGERENDWRRYIPPNLKELVEEIFNKRHGAELAQAKEKVVEVANGN